MMRRLTFLDFRFLERFLPIAPAISQPCGRSLSHSARRVLASIGLATLRMDAMFDAYSGMERQQCLGGIGETTHISGRSKTAGLVKCPLCPGRRQKRFCSGRGLRMHFAAVHADAGATVLTEAMQTVEVESVGLPATSRMPEACEAARDGDEQKLAQLYSTGRWHPLDPAFCDKHGYRAHHWAAGTDGGCLNFCLTLASAREVDDATREERREGKRGGRTLLHWAARNGIAAHARLLLAPPHSTQVDARTADGTTPLMLALYSGRIEVAEVLIATGASMRCTNDWGCSCVHWASMGSCPIRTLPWLQEKLRVSCGKNTDHDDSDYFVAKQVHGHTAFHKLAQRGQAAAALLLAHDLLKSSTRLLHTALAKDAGGRCPSRIAACAGFDHAATVLYDLEQRVDAATQHSLCHVRQ